MVLMRELSRDRGSRERITRHFRSRGGSSNRQPPHASHKVIVPRDGTHARTRPGTAIAGLVAKDLPGPLVGNQGIPETADLSGPSERLGIIDEAEHVEGDLGGQLSQKVSLEPGLDEGVCVDELVDIACLDKLRDEFPSLGGRQEIVVRQDVPVE
jgi:hypothetical protein